MTMGHFVTYMFVAGITLLCMYIIYKWLLSSENQPAFNRAVLLGIYAVAFGVAALPGLEHSFTPVATEASIEPGTLQVTGIAVDEGAETPGFWIYLPSILIWLYLAGATVMTAFTIITWARLAMIVRRGEKSTSGRYTLVLTDDNDVAPFSWLHYIVMCHKDYDNAGQMIIAHETRHLDARHPLDMMLAQLVIILLWYNPASWLMSDELRSVHEYQADMAVLRSGIDARSYQLLLIKKAVGRSFPALANSLNHSKLKKRITMMLKSKSSKSRRMRALALVPAIAVAVAVVNTPFMTRALDAMHDSTAETFSEVDKVSENNATDAISATEIDGLKGNVASVTKTETETSAKSESKDKGKTVETTINIDDKHSKGEVKVYVNGKLYTKDLKNISPEEIKSITVNKKGEDAIYVTLYKDGEKRASANLDTGQSEPLKVVNVASEKMPQFPGGESAMMQWLVQNLKFPKSEMNNAGTHRVVVQFVVETDGSIGETKVIRSQGEAFDTEAQRVVKAMPKWIPGEIDGKPAAVYYTLPVSFKVDAPKKNESKK